jgi:hypothetical protein
MHVHSQDVQPQVTVVQSPSLKSNTPRWFPNYASTGLQTGLLTLCEIASCSSFCCSQSGIYMELVDWSDAPPVQGWHNEVWITG